MTNRKHIFAISVILLLLVFLTFIVEPCSAASDEVALFGIPFGTGIERTKQMFKQRGFESGYEQEGWWKNGFSPYSYLFYGHLGEGVPVRIIAHFTPNGQLAIGVLHMGFNSVEEGKQIADTLATSYMQRFGQGELTKNTTYPRYFSYKWPYISNNIITITVREDPNPAPKQSQRNPQVFNALSVNQQRQALMFEQIYATPVRLEMTIGDVQYAPQVFEYLQRTKYKF